MPGGETKEEVTIMGHVRTFIEKFRNPNFVGFKAAGSVGSGSLSRTASPVPGGVGGAVLISVPAAAASNSTATVSSESQGQGTPGETAATTTNEGTKEETNRTTDSSTNGATYGDETTEHE